jgi:Ca2+-binding EF-hand superfamily protein
LLEGTNSAFAPTQVAQSNAVESPIPGLGDAEGLPTPKLSRPVAFVGNSSSEAQQSGETEKVNMIGGLSGSTYKRAFQIIAFWQACIVTSLIVTILSEPFENNLEIALYTLAWVEWPIMLFYVVPIFLRRFTVRNSIEKKKDMKTIRRVSLKTKEGLLKDYVRLFQVFAMAQRAKKAGELWAVPGHEGWTTENAKEKWEQGLKQFREIPQADKLDIWKIYAAWDVNNDETVCANEISETLSTLWVSSDGEPSVETANNLIRLVDHDNTGTLSWRKFKALVMLATKDRQRSEVLEDLHYFFEVLDADGDGEITIFELSEWSKRGPIGMEIDEFATLLYQHFDKAKPSVTEEEFVEWVEAF